VENISKKEELCNDGKGRSHEHKGGNQRRLGIVDLETRYVKVSAGENKNPSMGTGTNWEGSFGMRRCQVGKGVGEGFRPRKKKVPTNPEEKTGGGLRP